MNKFYNGRIITLFISMFLLGNVVWGQNMGDYRTAQTAVDWNTAANWQTWNGSNWVTASNAPGASNNVYVQSGHTVTLSTDVSCKDLYISTGTTSATAGTDAKVALTDYALNINGKLSCYFGSVDIAENSSTALTTTASGTVPSTPITKTANSSTGRIRFVAGDGTDRSLIPSGEWGAGNTGSTTTFDLEVSLNTSQTGTVGANVKAFNWYISSGILDVGTDYLSADNGTPGQGDITISAGATLVSSQSGSSGSSPVFLRGTTPTKAGTLTVNGTLRLMGISPSIAMTAIAFNGTVEYAKNGSQNFVVPTGGGANTDSYNNITLSGTSASTNNKTIGTAFPDTLKGVLTINGSAVLVSGSNNLIIKSTAANTARIAPITSTATTPISGTVTVERYISSANNRAYRILAPSVNTSGGSKQYIHDNWQEGATSNSNNPVSGYGTHITGTTVDQTNGFDGTTTGQPSLFTYNQASPAWNPIPNTNATPLDAKTGYLIFIRGDRTSSNITSTTSSNTTLRATGSLLTGDQTYTLQPNQNDYTLVTNPYASPISWSSIYSDAANTNLVAAYTYWDPNVGTRGGYVAVTNTGTKSPNTGNATVEIQSGQAFFVQASAANPTLTIKEAHKSTTSNIDVFRTGAQEQLATSLYFTMPDGSRRIADGVNSIFDNSYSVKLGSEDIQEIANFDENVAIARDGKMLSIEGRPLIDAADNIPLSISNLKQQGYEWQFDPSAFSSANLQAYLQDNFLHTQTAISLTNTTVIPFTVTADASSSAADRFAIVFSSNTLLPVTITSISARKQASGVEVDWSVVAENNIDKYTIEKSPNGTEFTAAASVASLNSPTAHTYNWFDAAPNAGDNYYRIVSINKNGNAAYSNAVKVNIANGSEKVSIYPNPIVGNVIGLQLDNFEKGKYTVTLTNQLGQQVYQTVVNHSGGSLSENLQVSGDFEKGVYQLQIKGDKVNVTKQIVKQ